MKTPAEVIGRNVKALREAHGKMTAGEFGTRIGAILGRPWPRQAVYLLEQGDRRVTAEEVATIALVFGVPVADLFTPDAEVDEVQVGHRRVTRERLLAQGQKHGAQLYEVARHSQALERAFRDLTQTISAQLSVLDNLDRALSGKPTAEVPPEVPSGAHGLKSFVAASQQRDYELAQKWYQPEPQETFPDRGDETK
jgi:transcriptional regulator with XRE-family HTH domain